MENESKKREQYYALVHENVKAEFINGEIVYQSPVKRIHWKISSRIANALITYVEANQLGEVAVEKAMVSLSRNDYEPDICFFRDEIARQFTDDQMHFPAPDFVIEIISPSTEKIDREQKFVDYAAHGVQEYWIIDPVSKSIEKYINREKEFVLSEKIKQGVVNSQAVSGFSISVQEVFK